MATCKGEIGVLPTVPEQLRATRKGQLHYDPDWSPLKSDSVNEQQNDRLRISPMLLEKQKAYSCITTDSSSSTETNRTFSSESKGELNITPNCGFVHNITPELSEEFIQSPFPTDSKVVHWKDGSFKNNASMSSHEISMLSQVRDEGRQSLNSLIKDINASVCAKKIEKKEFFEKYMKQLAAERELEFTTIKEESSIEVTKDLLEMQNLLLQHKEKEQEESDRRKKIHKAHSQANEDKLNDIVSKKKIIEEKKRVLKEKERKEEEKRRREEDAIKRGKEEEEKRMLETARILENIGEKAKKCACFIFDSIKSCPAKRFLPKESHQISEVARNEFMKCITIVSEGVSDKNSLAGKIEEAKKSVAVLESLVEHTKVAVEIAEKDAKEAAAKQQVEQKMLSTNPSIPTTIANQPQGDNQVMTITDELAVLDTPEYAGVCLSSGSIDGYKRLRQYLVDHRKKYDGMLTTTDKNRKRVRFNLKGAINTPLNTVSDQTPRHLLDKIRRLTLVLTGKSLDVSGKRVDPLSDPEGLDYCKGLFAQELVMQGAKQVASSHNSAFPFAVVALGIWVQLPEVGELLLANFYEKCPYLVPFYPAKMPSESTPSYFKRLGYEVDGDVVETSDKYLKKLSGIVRLYAALIQSPVPPQFARFPHPHGLPHGWAWCARILNLPPIPTVTATIIYDFLEVAGHAFLKVYGVQFKKLLRVLCDSYIKEIDSVTPKDQRGPVIRIKSFLEKSIRTGKIDEPKGYLSGGWWTSH